MYEKIKRDVAGVPSAADGLDQRLWRKSLPARADARALESNREAAFLVQFISISDRDAAHKETFSANFAQRGGRVEEISNNRIILRI